MPPGRRLLYRHNYQGARRDDDVYVESDELGRNVVDALRAGLSGAKHDGDSAAIDPTELMQPLREGGNSLALVGRRAGDE